MKVKTNFLILILNILIPITLYMLFPSSILDFLNQFGFWQATIIYSLFLLVLNRVLNLLVSKFY